MIMRERGRTAAITPADTANRLKHLGIKFESKLSELITKAIKQLWQPENYSKHLDILVTAHLGLGSKEPRTEEKRREHIATKLHRKEFPISLAKKAVDSMCLQNSYEERKPVVLFRPTERTAYDLFNALGREARSFSIRHREAAEQLAYMLMSGKLVIS